MRSVTGITKLINRSTIKPWYSCNIHSQIFRDMRERVNEAERDRDIEKLIQSSQRSKGDREKTHDKKQCG